MTPYNQWGFTRLFAFVCGLFFTCSSFALQRAQVTERGDGALATVNALATQAGMDAYAAGGNAIDAALAAAFTLGVVDSHNSGIGGGLFALVRWADGTVEAIDGREMAPAKAHRDMFVRNGRAQPELSKVGALAIGIPGSVAALHYMADKGGKRRFEQAILPAAKIAEQGFKVDRVLAARMARSKEALAKFPETAEIFLNQNGGVFAEGDVLRQSDLARTYQVLAKKGPKYFYRGQFAKRVDKWMRKQGGLVRRKDFKAYRLKFREPIRSQFAGYDIIGFPPPSSGGAHVAQILNMVSRFDYRALPEADRYHVLIESMKLAFADRAHWMGDADFVPVPRGLIDPNYANSLAKKINIQAATPVSSHALPPNFQEDVFGKHTTHIAAADKQGNWVAITTTLNTSFGSKVVIPGTGVLMNNQMDDFSSQPGMPNAFGLVGAEANSIEPAKRPLSSMSPTLVLKEGRPVMTLGAAGGPTIISQVVQVMVRALELEQSLPAALEGVRVHHQWRPDRVLIDGFADPKLKAALENKGHELRVWPAFGATQAIKLEGKKFVAVSEPRLDKR